MLMLGVVLVRQSGSTKGVDSTTVQPVFVV